ncbi:hypothetical protein P692DRAFT_20342700 [Suillus brevipes Sb2]|nr:hypothetical protein P692DRAFT_20342700 [Suillus brevipes Sb2]
MFMDAVEWLCRETCVNKRCIVLYGVGNNYGPCMGVHWTFVTVNPVQRCLPLYYACRISLRNQSLKCNILQELSATLASPPSQWAGLMPDSTQDQDHVHRCVESDVHALIGRSIGP